MIFNIYLDLNCLLPISNDIIVTGSNASMICMLKYWIVLD